MINHKNCEGRPYGLGGGAPTPARRPRRPPSLLLGLDQSDAAAVALVDDVDLPRPLVLEDVERVVEQVELESGGVVYAQDAGQLVPGIGGRIGFSGIGVRYVALLSDEIDLLIAIDLDVPGAFRTF